MANEYDARRQLLDDYAQSLDRMADKLVEFLRFHAVDYAISEREVWIDLKEKVKDRLEHM